MIKSRVLFPFWIVLFTSKMFVTYSGKKFRPQFDHAIAKATL